MKYFVLFVSVCFLGLAFLLGHVYLLQMYGLMDVTEIPIVLPDTLSYEDAKQQLIGQDVGVIIFIFVFLNIGFYLFYLYRRLSRKKKDTKTKEEIVSPFVLYLRSFVDDAKTKKRVMSLGEDRTEEEILVEVFSDIAPVYAIGDPKDKKMPLGASRIYVSDEVWKSTVHELAMKAELVLLRLGKTNSFWWEVEMAISHIPLEKIVFIVPHSDTFDNVAMLYKILLEHGVNIEQVGIQVDKKIKGSISSLLYFDREHKPFTATLEIHRFTGIFISYDVVLRKALSGLRARYGFPPYKKMSVAKARVFQILIIIYVLFIGFSRTFSDLISLKYQLPYEMVEGCINDPVFVEKYSSDINGTNLTWSLIEATKGRFLLSDDEFLTQCLIEYDALLKVEYDEFVHLNDNIWNNLLLIKKYNPIQYDTYLLLMQKAAILSVNNDIFVNDVILNYQSRTDDIPIWVIEEMQKIEERKLNEYETYKAFNEAVMQHISDENIVDVLKILIAQGLNVQQ